MRLLFLITGLDYGGAEMQLVQRLPILKDHGWEMCVISLLSPRAYAQDIELLGIPVVSLGVERNRLDPRIIMRLSSLIRRYRPHIVHSHMVHANLLARVVRPLAGIPVLVCTAHNICEKGRKGSGRLREFLYRITDPLCDMTTQVSQAGLERYVRVRAVPMHKILYIPNGVCTESFRPDSAIRVRKRKEMRLGDHFVWLAVGRFAPQKDYPNMLLAFAQILRKQPETRLLIVGDGPLRTSIQFLAQSLGIANQVCFLGIRQDIAELMNAVDAYVMSSEWEGMPNVLLEAASTGLPIVATDVGGNREIVLNGVTGFLVPPKDPEALAQAMLQVMDLPREERYRMGKTARQHIVANFSLERVVHQWEALYRELLIRKGLQIE